VSVSNLWKEIHIKSIENSLWIIRLMWLGRLTRMDGNRLVNEYGELSVMIKSTWGTKTELSENRKRGFSQGGCE
jgi:hypothetical protein